MTSPLRDLRGARVEGPHPIREPLTLFQADGAITRVLSHNKCAAGSGEFFVQQVGRMGLDIDEAIALSFTGKVVPLASRCSVHCKSNITHKLNLHEASAADILHTLHDSIANAGLYGHRARYSSCAC